MERYTNFVQTMTYTKAEGTIITASVEVSKIHEIFVATFKKYVLTLLHKKDDKKHCTLTHLSIVGEPDKAWNDLSDYDKGCLGHKIVKEYYRVLDEIRYGDAIFGYVSPNCGTEEFLNKYETLTENQRAEVEEFINSFCS